MHHQKRDAVSVQRTIYMKQVWKTLPIVKKHIYRPNTYNFQHLLGVAFRTVFEQIDISAAHNKLKKQTRFLKIPIFIFSVGKHWQSSD